MESLPICSAYSAYSPCHSKHDTDQGSYSSMLTTGEVHTHLNPNLGSFHRTTVSISPQFGLSSDRSKIAKPSHSTLVLLLDPLVVIFDRGFATRAVRWCLVAVGSMRRHPATLAWKIGVCALWDINGRVDAPFFKCLIVCTNDTGTLRTISLCSTGLNAFLTFSSRHQRVNVAPSIIYSQERSASMSTVEFLPQSH
jgi:hypothetical protein